MSAERNEAEAGIDWVAAMISPVEDLDGAPLLRREFALSPDHGPLTDARLHVSSLGVYQVFMNGRSVGDDVLSPGWSSYQWRLRYRTYDLLQLVEERSVLGVALGNGWYRGRLGWSGARAVYGERLGLIAQLALTFTDGHVQVVVSNEDWRAGPSDVLSNDLYDGESIDSRRRDDAWLHPDFGDHDWIGVDILPFDTARLTPYVGPAVRRHEHLSPVDVVTSSSGRAIFDFGQNLTGWTKLWVEGPAGCEVTVSHAEVLEHGQLGTRPLRSAKATDRYILSGGKDVFEPTMTFHGFRYAQVDGWPGDEPMSSKTIEAIVVHSDLERTGHFECSDNMLNRLHQNVVWGFRGNALDVPTDCPQRDERMGWTGDLAVFAPTAAYLYDVYDFLADWLLDLAAEQRDAEGLVPLVVPDPLSLQGHDAMSRNGPYALWGDAAVWVPWALWRAYGDRRILVVQYDSMAAHVRRVVDKVSPNGLWDTGFQFGDWVDPDAPPDEPWRSKVDPGVVATACLYRTARLVAETAVLLGRQADAKRYETLAGRTRDAFVKHYVVADGTVRSDAQTGYALAIAFGLLDHDPALRARAGDRLAELVRSNGYRVGTGFAGTPYILDALTDTGHLDDAYNMLLERACPSWLYPVTMGATTVWERWDSMLPDGTINPGEMTSFNHYALGAVADWMHRTIGGIAPLTPGYGRVLVAPRPGGGLTSAAASVTTRHGLVSVEWRLQNGQLAVRTELPDGVTGILHLPGREPETLGSP
jgi:alpha-L-rhamnosidase